MIWLVRCCPDHQMKYSNSTSKLYLLYKYVQAIWFAHLRDDQGLSEQEIYEWCVRYPSFFFGVVW